MKPNEIERALAPLFPDAAVSEVRRLSGGASQETWAFEVRRDQQLTPLILRRGVGGDARSSVGSAGIDLATEAELVILAAQSGVPVPRVHRVLEADDGLGAGFIMERIAGETIPRRILRAEELAAARPLLARQCGEILARIHAIPPVRLPTPLATAGAAAQLEQFRSVYDSFDFPHPVFELAFRWLLDHLPPESAPALVHGDFRNGNLIVDGSGVRAVLDWELAHRGDPMEDLGWICVGSWRFGNVDQPVGGFGSREEMFAGYASAGGVVDAERVRFWEVMGTLKWGVMCKIMYGIYRSGLDASVERAAIGRRASETELDLLNLLAPRTRG